MAEKNISTYEAHKELSGNNDIGKMREELNHNTKGKAWNKPKEQGKETGNKPSRGEDNPWMKVPPRKEKEIRTRAHGMEETKQQEREQHSAQPGKNATNEYYRVNFDSREEEITKEKRGLVINYKIIKTLR